MSLLHYLIVSKLLGSGASVTPASVLSAMEGMDSAQAAAAREAIDAAPGVVIYVTEFGAKGDGITDDASAIQDALDEASDGCVVYFPAGTYLLKETVKFHSNMLLYFEPGATLLQGAAIDNLMRNYAVLTDTAYSATSNVRIIGATFDGGAYTVNNALLAFCHAENISVEGCTFVNGYGEWHDIEINSSKNVTIKNCRFDAARRSTENPREIIQVDALTARIVYPWTDEGAVDGTPCANVVIDSCEFIAYKFSAIGHHNTVSVNGIEIKNCKITGTDSTAAIKLPYCSGLVVSECVIDGCAAAVSVATSLSGAIIYSNTFTGGGSSPLFAVYLNGARNADVFSNNISSYKLGIHIMAAQNATINERSAIHDNLLRGMTGFEGYPNNTPNYTDNGIIYSNTVNGVFDAGALSAKPAIVSDLTSTSITLAYAADNTIYSYGELTALTVTAIPATGDFIIRFTSGSTATTTNFPATMIFPEAFAAEANTRYEINVSNGYALVVGWPTT